jgi:hypothetical protein
MMQPPERIRMLEDSLRCYAYGWCSFIPLVGLPLLVLTLIKFQKTRVRAAGEWNAASRYLNWGVILASIGGFLSALWFGLIILGIMAMNE